MPGDAVLTGASTITCGHPGGPPPAKFGLVQPVPSTRLIVDGQGVLTVPPAAVPVIGCLQPPPTAANPNSQPCTTSTITATGAAQHLHVDGVAVLLATTLTGQSTGLPHGMAPASMAAPPATMPMVVTPNQTLLTAQ
jgi:hypothetical protein